MHGALHAYTTLRHLFFNIEYFRCACSLKFATLEWLLLFVLQRVILITSQCSRRYDVMAMSKATCWNLVTNPAELHINGVDRSVIEVVEIDG
jgi:hypothetical protein